MEGLTTGGTSVAVGRSPALLLRAIDQRLHATVRHHLFALATTDQLHQPQDEAELTNIALAALR